MLLGSEGCNLREDSVPFGVWGAVSAPAVSGRFRGVLARRRRDIGSKDIMRGLGSGMGAMSMDSIRLTFVSHDAVGDMVVGRVIVAVNMYDIVPRSNFGSGQQQLTHEKLERPTSILLGNPFDGNSSSKLK